MLSRQSSICTDGKIKDHCPPSSVIEVSDEGKEKETSEAELGYLIFIIFKYAVLIIRQNNYQRIRSHWFMCFSSLFQPLSILSNVTSMFLSVQQPITWERGMAKRYIDTLTPVTQSPLEIFINMPKSAGARELWWQLSRPVIFNLPVMHLVN